MYVNYYNKETKRQYNKKALIKWCKATLEVTVLLVIMAALSIASNA